MWKYYEILTLTNNTYNQVMIRLEGLLGHYTTKYVLRDIWSNIFENPWMSNYDRHHRICREFNDILRSKGVNVCLTFDGGRIMNAKTRQ